MRHNAGYRKLGRTKEHRKALLRNLATDLFRHERLTTTLPKAKELRPYAERLITMARRDDLHSRRMVLALVHDKGVVKKMFDTLGPRFATRPGGYSRILKLGPRPGDGADMAIVELVGSEPVFKKQKEEKKARRDRKAKVREKEEAEADMLVLGCVHAAAQRVGHLPELGFVPNVSCSVVLCGVSFSSFGHYPVPAIVWPDITSFGRRAPKSTGSPLEPLPRGSPSGAIVATSSIANRAIRRHSGSLSRSTSEEARSRRDSMSRPYSRARSLISFSVKASKNCWLFG